MNAELPLPGPALLFCPADRPYRYAKAAAAADTVILDLEDAVARDGKDAARRALLTATSAGLRPETTIVRVNASDTGEQEADIRAVLDTPFRTLMLPKAESPEQVEALTAAIPDVRVVALCESPLGIVRAEDLAACDAVVALTWGAEDLAAAIGGTSSRRADGRYRDVARHARARVLIAAAAFGKPAYDTVHLDIADEEGLAEEAADAYSSGFAGALCIHPRQVAVLRRAFAPSADAVAWALEVMDAANASENGVFTVRGRMVDEPLMRQARSILTAAHNHEE
ncbi:HpcH/HpaI aldolase/citrate lyase family protein [Humibacter ginsengisoli]